MNGLTPQLESRWPRRWAVLLVCATFPLIWVGGLVTTYKAGMAVPDWPETYGYNLFLYPWQTWLSGPFDLFVEHGHRLLAVLIGLLTIGLLISVYRSEKRRWLKILSLGALVAVIAQGALGGARVLLDERTLALVHACTGPAFFALVVVVACTLARSWKNPPERLSAEKMSVSGISRIAQWAVLASGLVYLQLILGALVRHAPVTISPGTFGVFVQFHLVMAAAVTIHMLVLVGGIWRQRQSLPASLCRPAYLVLGCLLVQLLLGGASWVSRFGWPGFLADRDPFSAQLIQAQAFWPSMMITAHVATGSLILALSVMLAVRSMRLRYQLAVPTAVPAFSFVLVDAGWGGGLG
ncbi:MAG: COX15/CtaA family protein [Pirellulaceae bacterium]